VNDITRKVSNKTDSVIPAKSAFTKQATQQDDSKELTNSYLKPDQFSKPTAEPLSTTKKHCEHSHTIPVSNSRATKPLVTTETL
jgi:hypothetical protein